MKINAFHIRNYRSIIDSQKRFLSPDNITALIGQNESGKTSVLEALKSFYEGNITDDVLRSDQTFPSITCTFSLENNEQIDQIINLGRLPDELRESLAEKREISLERRWLNTSRNIIEIAEPEVILYYKKIEDQKNNSEQTILSAYNELSELTEAAARETEISENAVTAGKEELANHTKRFDELMKLISKAKRQEIVNEARSELDELKEQIGRNEASLKEKIAVFEKNKSILQELVEKLKSCKWYNEIQTKVTILNRELTEKTIQIGNLEHQLELISVERDSKAISKQLEQLKTAYYQLQNELKAENEYLSIRRKTADRVLNGMAYKQAENEAINEYEQEKKLITSQEIAMQVFKHIPIFEFFEDFSSLLPNKIDLEDLLNENSTAEGFKAARNFLYIAGLNADFFREQNHRILKQKIENLNSEITIDFQDYWRQSIGKNDKIRINFEREHYDYTKPEKSGKPYLEFWIKDKNERLYPKQRSRGVRWFLSFYLELKATAKQNTKNRVILIDEPGLSLHARAQEDVLKVFEDLRENLQIVYCTHSPNLIDLQKLYRIIAVQRAREEDECSETIVLDAHCLHDASSDTLSPIYALMGTKLNDKQFIFPDRNIIVEDTITFYYLDTMQKLMGIGNDIHFIPSSGPENIPTISNILFGWKIKFALLIMDNQQSKKVVELLKQNTFFQHQDASSKLISCLNGFRSIEDLFSTIDFKRFVLQKRTGITDLNSEYIENNHISRIILVTDFCSKVENDSVQLSDFDEETRTNFKNLFDQIHSLAT